MLFASTPRIIVTLSMSSLRLEVVAETIELCEQEFNVILCDSGIGHDVAEEIRKMPQRLIGYHQASGVHHARLQLSGDLEGRY